MKYSNCSASQVQYTQEELDIIKIWGNPEHDKNILQREIYNIRLGIKETLLSIALDRKEAEQSIKKFVSSDNGPILKNN